MKKWISIVLMLVMSLSLMACDENKKIAETSMPDTENDTSILVEKKTWNRK